jgi:hypothetical protein
MNDLFNELGRVLKPHAAMVSEGVLPVIALNLMPNKYLAVQPKPLSLTETYRRQLATIAQSVDVNINALMAMLTPRQAEEVIAQHKHIAWSNPDAEDRSQDLHLSCIERNGSKQEWWLGFTTPAVLDGDEPLLTYRLHDLEIQDVLAFMATCENVLGI